MYLIVVTALCKGEKGGQSMHSYFPIFEEIQAAKDAEELLENLSFLDQNVFPSSFFLQSSILRTFLARSQSPSGEEIRAKLRQMNYVAANSNNLFPHFSNAYAIYSSLLSKDWVKHAAMGVISNLPNNPQITMWLLEAGAFQVISTSLTDGSRNASHRRQITYLVTGI
ncbi:hypothetical protein NC651_033142 [Populus alba x Populus x berolinensis]|nr:hypothetical protein NC651_033142 [Populus alba x Populus x berolinensis]